MDTTKAVAHIGLCSGYGGIDLGIKRVCAGVRTVAYSEIEAYACAILVARMEAGQLDAAPIWTDVKTFPWGWFRGKVGLLTGGYPCQPFSAAGRRRGKEDHRHLWPWIADGIRVMRPARVFFENVEGHISLGLREVIADLEGLGYRATWGILSAAEVGAGHGRKRVFIMADSCDEGLQGYWESVRVGYEAGREDENGYIAEGGGFGGAWPARIGEEQYAWEPRRTVGDTKNVFSNGGEDNARGGEQREAVSESGNAGRAVDDSTSKGLERAAGEGVQTGECGLASADMRQGAISESAMGGVPYGVAGGMDYAELCASRESFVDELRAIGNGVVPAVAAKAFLTLHNRLVAR